MDMLKGFEAIRIKLAVYGCHRMVCGSSGQHSNGWQTSGMSSRQKLDEQVSTLEHTLD